MQFGLIRGELFAIQIFHEEQDTHYTRFWFLFNLEGSHVSEIGETDRVSRTSKSPLSQISRRRVN